MGFDCNKIDMVCFGSAYQSEQNVIQMIGRGLRQYKNKVLKVIIPVIENDIKKKNYEKIKTVI